MKIHSEQEMLTFGKQFASYLTGRVTDLEGIPQSTRRVELREGKVRQDPSNIVIELIGDVGAGKTTFVRGFAKGLGVKEPVTSPSFTISKSYACANGKTLTHYDFYRLGDPGLMTEDLKEKKANDNIIIVEWSDSIKDILPKNRTIIKIEYLNDDSREITVNQSYGRVTDLEGIPQSTRRVELREGKVRQDPSKNLSLYLDTATPTTILKLNDKVYEWHSDRDLAEKLLKFIHDKLAENGKDWHDLTEITFMSGPGSFTGLRIGATVVNTLASELNIPLYNHKGKKVKIILPDYDRGANISKPQK